MKVTKLWVGYFMIISVIFSPTTLITSTNEDLRVILVCPIYKNLSWIKSYDINHNFLFVSFFFNFVRKKNENLQLIIGHFITISGQFSANYNRIFHQTEVQTVILRCFVYLYLNWIKCNDIILVKIYFFSCLKMHHFRGISPK